jgi:formate hydrogenlyase subunit 3/multisubunit Na+/H+ antiporter MnhD subunit
MFLIFHPNSVSLLAFTIYLSFAGALLQALLPKGRAALSRWLALAVAVAGLALAVQGFVAGMGQGRVVLVDLPWVPSMGIHGRRHQPRAGAAHRPRRRRRGALQLEH